MSRSRRAGGHYESRKLWQAVQTHLQRLAWPLLCITALAFAQPASVPKPPPPAKLPLPELAQLGPLRVGYIDNPRFAPLSTSDQVAVLARAKILLKAHFGIEVAFDLQPGSLPIEALFDAVPPAGAALVDRAVFDFKNGTGNVARLVSNTAKQLQADGDNDAAARAFAQPHLRRPPAGESAEAFAKVLVETQLARIAQWHSAAPNAAIDAKPYNEFEYWRFLGALDLPYELLLTNQLIASVEYSSNSVHSALRGGLTNGVTFPSIRSKTGSYSVASSFPFVATDSAVMSLRDGEFASRQEMLEGVAVLVVHELGHQLLHLGHPYGNRACIMTPTELLRFKQWLADLNPSQCALGSSPAMTPGSKINFPDVRGRPVFGQLQPASVN